MPIFLDLTKSNLKTKKPWTSQSHTILNGLRIDFQWVNNQRDQGFESPDKTCLHWTAGGFSTVYDDYHYNIVWDMAKRDAYVVRALDWNDKSAHLWKRNTNTVGITLCSMSEGKKPPAKMIIVAGVLNSEVCAWKKINPRSRVNVPQMRANADVTQLVPTGNRIDVPSCWDHAGYAQSDNYAAWRWDCRLKLDYLSKAERKEVIDFLGVPDYNFSLKTVFDLYLDVTLKNYDDLKSGKAQFDYEEILK